MAQPRDNTIPFWGQESGLEEVAGGAPYALNVVRDPDGTIRRRPGIRWYGTRQGSMSYPRRLVGLHAATNGNIYALVDGTARREILRVAAIGVGEEVIGSIRDHVASLSDGPLGMLEGTGRPIAAETEAMVVFAAGGPLQKLVFADTRAERLGGNPPEATHVAANASRLIANSPSVDRSKVHFSDLAAGSSTAGHEVWGTGFGTAGFVSAEGRPDPVVAIHESTNEVWVFGSSTLQLFGPDPSTVYAPISTREWGCGAPYSVIKTDAEFAWMDQQRRIVISDGRSLQVISDGMRRTFEQLRRVDDCWGCRVNMGNVDALCWTFPTDRVTYVYQRGVGWGQWQSWDEEAGGWAAWLPTALTVRPENGQHLVAVRADDGGGTLGYLDLEATSDLDAPVIARVGTGYIDRGTHRQKHCSSVTLTFRPLVRESSTDELVGWLRWRDRPGPWEGEVPVSFDIDTSNEIAFTTYSLGVYRRRQWEFEVGVAESVALVAAHEEWVVLDT